jgi:hypothetical protein
MATCIARPPPEAAKRSRLEVYGLPPDLDLSFFHGKTLLQVCIGANQLTLSFDDRVSITIWSVFGYAPGKGPQRIYDDYRAAAGVVVRFIQETVVSAKGNAKGTLTLEFTGGGRFSVFDDSKQFESYQIKNADVLIVV